MHFRRLQIHAFGRLGGLDTGPEPLGRLVVVHGPNESGKSTFFSFLTTMLYGFYPASRESNPFSPWSGAEPSGRAEIVVGDETIEVERRLRSSPSGVLARGSRTEELRNHTLGVAEHVPMTVFRQVFALTLKELTALEGESWARVQDRVVTRMGSADLRAPRDVAAELEREAGALWRPNHRGNQRIRELRERVRHLAKQRRAATDNDRKLRTLSAELEETRVALAEARTEREECLLFIERYGALLPVRDQLDRIRSLEETAGAAGELDALPPDPGARLRELTTSISDAEEHLAEIDHELDAARDRRDAFDGEAGRLVERKESIRTLTARVAALEPVRVRSGQLEQEIRDLTRRVDALADEVLSEGADGGEDAIRGLSAERIREAAEAVRRALGPAAEVASPPPSRVPLWLSLLLLLLGLVGAAAGLVTGSLATSAIGTLTSVVGAALVGRAWSDRGRGRAGEHAESQGGRAADRVGKARDALRAAFGDLEARPGIIEHPPSDLGARVRRLQELLRDRGDRETQLGSLEREIAGVESAVLEERRLLRLSLPDDTGAAAYALEERLHEAERLKDAASAAAQSIERLERAGEKVRERAQRLREERAALREHLERIGDGDLDSGLESAEKRLRAGDRARNLAAELEARHPDLAEIRRRIAEAETAGEDWVVDDRALARRRARIEELAAEIEERSGRMERLRTEISYLSKEVTADVLEGELAAVREEIADETRERDRLWVMAALIRQADRRFREEHQPEVLRSAGEKLSWITGGRYERLLVNEERSEASFHLRGEALPGIVELGPPISTGTREQTYLALRLAVLDHLDRGGERLPVFMDEAFVNWDVARRQRGFELLRRLSVDRQVFVFTCHETMAEELADHGAQRIDLPPIE